LTWRACSSWLRVLRRRRRVDLGERRGEGAVEIAAAKVGQHVVLVDRLALGVRQEGGLEPRAGVQLDLAVLEVRLHVEEDHEPVVEALAPDAPLVHQRPRLRLGLLGGREAAAVLGVDDDLGAGPRLDAVDRGFGLDDRVRREDAREVVDGAVRLGLGEGRPGWHPGRAGRIAAGRRVRGVQRPVDHRARATGRRRRNARPGEREHVVLVDRLELDRA
jgi:hypothetical protein